MAPSEPLITISAAVTSGPLALVCSLLSGLNQSKPGQICFPLAHDSNCINSLIFTSSSCNSLSSPKSSPASDPTYHQPQLSVCRPPPTQFLLEFEMSALAFCQPGLYCISSDKTWTHPASFPEGCHGFSSDFRGE